MAAESTITDKVFKAYNVSIVRPPTQYIQAGA